MSSQYSLNSAPSAFRQANMQGCPRRTRQQQIIDNQIYLAQNSCSLDYVRAITTTSQNQLIKNTQKTIQNPYRQDQSQQEVERAGTKTSFGNKIDCIRNQTNRQLQEDQDKHQQWLSQHYQNKTSKDQSCQDSTNECYCIAVSLIFRNKFSKTNKNESFRVKIKKHFPIKVSSLVDLIKESLAKKIGRISSEGKKIDEMEMEIAKISSFRTAQESQDMEIDLIFSLKNYQLVEHFFQVLHQKYDVLDQERVLWLEPVYVTKKLQAPHEGVAESTKQSLRDYQIIQFIGSGGFSNVYLARNIFSNVYCALKLILKEQIEDRKAQKIIEIQAKTLQSLAHPFITKLYSHFETEFFFVFAIQYCPGGQLFTRLRKVTHMSEEDAKFYFLQILLALNHMHQKGIIYRDIKPQNILIDMYGQLRLADFGLSKNIKRQKVAYSYCGSPQYMAPEMLKQTGHDHTLDYYCAACLLYQLVYSAPPFYSTNVQAIFSSIIRNQIQFPGFPNTSNQFKDFIRKLLNKNPAQRLGVNGIEEILDHPFLQKNWSKTKTQNQRAKKQRATSGPDSQQQQLQGLKYKQKLLRQAPFVPRPFLGEIIVSSGQDQGQQSSEQVQRIRKYEQFLEKQLMKQSAQCGRSQCGQSGQPSQAVQAGQSKYFKQLSQDYCRNEKEDQFIPSSSKLNVQLSTQLKQDEFIINQNSNRDSNSSRNQAQKRERTCSQQKPYSLTLSQSDMEASNQFKWKQNQVRQTQQYMKIPRLPNLTNTFFENTLTQRKGNENYHTNYNQDAVGIVISTQRQRQQFSKRKTNIGTSDFEEIKSGVNRQAGFKTSLLKSSSQNNIHSLTKMTRQSNLLYLNFVSESVGKRFDGKRINLDGSLSNYRYFNNANSEKSLLMPSQRHWQGEGLGVAPYKEKSKIKNGFQFQFSQFKVPLDNGIYKFTKKAGNNPFYLA